MLVTNHVLSGALIGYAAPDPVSSFVVGVVSHLALDAVPHWGVRRPIQEMMHVAVPDGLTGLATMAVITVSAAPCDRLRVLAGMAGAAFLDLDKPSRVFFGASFFPRAVDALHEAVQRESPHRMPQEIVVGLTGAAAVAVVVGCRRRATGGMPPRGSRLGRRNRRRTSRGTS
jgi:hypothetical protein